MFIFPVVVAEVGQILVSQWEWEALVEVVLLHHPVQELMEMHIRAGAEVVQLISTPPHILAGTAGKV